MQEREIRMLALNPGSRYSGIAVFHSSELVDWRVKSIREKSLRDRMERLKRFLTEIMDRDGINCLAIKRIHPARSSKYLCQLAREIKNWAVKRRLEVREYAIEEIETILSSSCRSNKRMLMEEVAARHPVLYSELDREKGNRNPYLVRMFEAVALGTKCLNDLEESKGRKRISTNHEN